MSLSITRNAVVHAVTNVYGAKREYAQELFAEFGSVLFAAKGSMESKSPEGKLLKTEKKALYDALKEANHSNPSKVWADVMKYAREAAGIVEPEKETGEARDLNVRNVEELLKLYKANAKDETGSMDEVNIHIGRALAELGVDLSETEI